MLTLFGKGFIGSRYCEMYDCIVTDRNDLSPQSEEILYLISTTDNYNVYINPYIDIETNLIHLIRVLEKCKDKNVVFNFASSWFVYGSVDIPAKEDSYCDPKGFYSITKRAAEQLLISYCETFDIKYRILRFANVIGSNDKGVSTKKNALTYLINQIKNNQEISLYDNGDFIRDYIHVDDICRAIQLITEKGEVNCVYNVGNGVPLKFRELIDYAINKTKSTSVIKNVEQSQFHKLVQVKSFWMNCDKLSKLGYRPQHDIYKTIDNLIGE